MHLCGSICKNECSAHRGQTGALEPLELELKVIVNHLMCVLGTKFLSPLGPECFLNL